MSETKTKTEAPARSLVKKLAEIMGEVERVPKNGRNNAQGYDYVMEADILDAVRGGMAKRSLVMFPSVVDSKWGELLTKSGGKLRLCTSTVCFTIEDGDSGETRSLNMLGEGTDQGDKASYKAATGAEKYALLKLFMISTGDDPERDDDSNKNLALVDGEVVHKPTEQARSKQSGGWVARFGKSKGKTAAELDDKNLAWYIGCVRDSIEDPEKAKFKEQNQRDLAELEAEAEHRRAKPANPMAGKYAAHPSAFLETTSAALADWLMNPLAELEAEAEHRRAKPANPMAGKYAAHPSAFLETTSAALADWLMNPKAKSHPQFQQKTDELNAILDELSNRPGAH